MGIVIQTTHTWEPARNVLDVKENKVGSAVVSSYDYSVNTLGQRTAVDTAGSAFAAGERDRTWSYDVLGQVTAESDANNSAFNRGFSYDAIGNRTASIEGNTDPTQAGATTYTPTALNQYDAIGAFSPTYDDDGNQLESQIRPLGSSGLESCVFVWDAENRLIEIKDAAGTTTLASYTYDSQSRRIARTVGTTSIVTLYDAWNPIAEYTGTPATGYTLQASYLWGLDLSGSMQGAGGVGGLLSVTSGAGSFYPTYDGNGNISEKPRRLVGVLDRSAATCPAGASNREAVASQYLDASGVVVAHYEYDAFGNVIFSSGASAASFQHRFSTKPQDAESGLYYYGYRYYDPLTGRWPSRDPIEERGGVNLYGFVGNDGVNGVDVLGHQSAASLDGAASCAEEGEPLPGPVGLANWAFDGMLFAFLTGSGPKQLDLNETHPWTQALMKLPVYNRLRDHVKGYGRAFCEGGDISFVGRDLQWDHSVDEDGPLTPLYDLAKHTNVLPGLKSLGSTQGEFYVDHASCCPCCVGYTIKIEGEFRLGSATRIPGTDTSIAPLSWPAWKRVITSTDPIPSLPSGEADNPFGDDGPLSTIKITWTWDERLYCGSGSE